MQKFVVVLYCKAIFNHVVFMLSLVSKNRCEIVVYYNEVPYISFQICSVIISDFLFLF